LRRTCSSAYRSFGTRANHATEAEVRSSSIPPELPASHRGAIYAARIERHPGRTSIVDWQPKQLWILDAQAIAVRCASLSRAPTTIAFTSPTALPVTKATDPCIFRGACIRWPAMQVWDSMPASYSLLRAPEPSTSRAKPPSSLVSSADSDLAMPYTAALSS